ncbi:MAG: hypothetical protein ACRDRW_19665 [Pseudonocardiaceae bacterium]
MGSHDLRAEQTTMAAAALGSEISTEALLTGLRRRHHGGNGHLDGLPPELVTGLESRHGSGRLVAPPEVGGELPHSLAWLPDHTGCQAALGYLEVVQNRSGGPVPGATPITLSGRLRDRQEADGSWWDKWHGKDLYTPLRVVRAEELGREVAG